MGTITLPIVYVVTYVVILIAAWASMIAWMRIAKNWKEIVRMQQGNLHHAAETVDALISRGTFLCDVCLNPIAPRTPTIIEEYGPGKYSIAHAVCPK